MKIMVFVS